jgi:hypothetical protein
LGPNTVLLYRNFVHLNVADRKLSVFLGYPEIDVVILISTAGLAEVSADKILAVLFEMADRLVNLDELKR